MIADIVSGEADLADLFFLVAVILFVVYTFIGFIEAVHDRLHNVLLGLGLACVSLSWLLL